MSKKCRLHNEVFRTYFLPGGRKVKRCPICEKEFRKSKFRLRLKQS